jgi:uncharacterized repeat protein (TIGR01451 family)
LRKRIFYYWMLPAAAGLALVLAAVLLSSASPGGPAVPGALAADDTSTPAATATVNPKCDLSIKKTAANSTVAEEGDATYTITVTNDGTGDCGGLTISDVIPDDTDCSSAKVASSSDISSSNFTISHCSSSGTVKWVTTKNLGEDEQAVVTLVLSLDDSLDKGDRVTNTACVTSTDDVRNTCDDVRITVGSEPTATPTVTRTPVTVPTVAPYVPPPPPPPPAAQPAPSVALPNTGAGSNSGGWSPLSLALAAAGACLLLVSGRALARKRIR